MAKQAVAIGTRIMAATPHRFSVKGGPQTIIDRVVRLQAELDAQGIHLCIIPGVEIPISLTLVDDLAASKIMCIGGLRGKSLLVEPPFDRIPGTALQALELVVDAGLVPILAHPERNREIQYLLDSVGQIHFLESCVDLGVVIQLTSGSVLGHFGPFAEAVSREVVKHSDWPIILASDAHWSNERTPEHLGSARDRVERWTSDAAFASAMVCERPSTLIPSPASPIS